MGLFDEFICPGVACPKCGAEVAEDWQSKALDCQLRRYHRGEPVEPDFGPTIREDRVPVYTICESCDAFLEAWAEIKDGRFVGIVEPTAVHWEV